MSTKNKIKYKEIKKDFNIIFQNAYKNSTSSMQFENKVWSFLLKVRKEAYKEGFDGYAKKEAKAWQKAMKITKEQTGLEGGNLLNWSEKKHMWYAVLLNGKPKQKNK